MLVAGLAASLVAPLVGIASRQEAAPVPVVKTVAIKCGRLIDGDGGAPVVNAVVIVEDERIKTIGTSVAIPPDAEVIDLSKSTVLPGLIDCHTHLTMQLGGGDFWEETATKSFVDNAVVAPK